MTNVMAHRGPDADGLFVDGPVGLGHRRLAIIDLSDRGRQPLSTPDGRYTIVFNGEIYNYIELREELVRAGHRFRTDTDTEVFLCLFALRGPACLAQLNGMFTAAIWDAHERQLFLARDRVGIKPLYYADTSNGLVFASEAKALFEYGVEARASVDDIDTFMTFGYVPGERTTFHGVKKLLPGHSLIADDDGYRTESYWELRYQPDRSRGTGETARELHALLLDACRIHLRSDVPVGVFLSGGLDSSAVVSLLSEAGIRGIKTFSVAYREADEFDESAYARLIAEQFGTQHHVLYVNPAQFHAFIPSYVWHMDEPVTEAAALSLFFVARELRRHVTVALSGEGADELFAGYQIYHYMRALEVYRRAPASVRQIVETMLHPFAGAKIRKYLALAREPLEQRYLGVSLHTVAEKRPLYGAEFARYLQRPAAEPLAPYYADTIGHDALTRMLYTDLKTWLVDDLLIKADKMTMANSVELRVPFLDYRVVEFAATVPSGMKLHGGDVKWVLKQAMASRLPPAILRRTKRGFPTPLAIMFRQNLADYLKDILLSHRAVERGYFTPQRVETLIDEHVAGRVDHHKILWQLVVLEEWHRCFIDAATATSRQNPEAAPPRATPATSH
jgi:asparagine synthase (glutamine-hydrolysing)